MNTGAQSTTRAIWDELRSIVSEQYLRRAKAEDAISGVQPQYVAEPASADEIAALLKSASGAGLAVVPRGGGSKMDWGNPPRRADLVISTARLNNVVEHAWDDLTVVVQSGCPMQTLQDTLAAHGQRLALDALWPERATVGGVLATNDSGAYRIRFGSLRDLVIGVTVVLADGTIAKSGGRVVKNVAGYDLPKLFTGSLGTLGVITEAVFRLYPAERNVRSITHQTDSSAQAQNYLRSVLDSKLSHTGLQLRASSQSAINVDVRFAGTDVGCDAQIKAAEDLGGKLRKQAGHDDPWIARQALWSEAKGIIAKISVLPSETEWLLGLLHVLPAEIQWQLVEQGTGLGTLRLNAADTRSLVGTVSQLRSAVEDHGGSLVVLRGPSELKGELEAWGTPGNALELMKRVKQRFDPKGTLNPGRFVGGI